MSVDALLTKLDSVRQVAHGRWRAKCPAHDGENPSALSIGETSDGVTLIKCFRGCSVSDVVQAVGLQLHDLFPRIDWQSTGIHGARPRRPRVDWPAAIGACERDLILVKIVQAQLARHEPINDEDAEACQRAATRVYRLLQEALFNALLEQGCAIEDVDDSSVIKALAFRGVALSSAAWTVLGDDSETAADSIEDLERQVIYGD